jgi:hypothetical protein
LGFFIPVFIFAELFTPFFAIKKIFLRF